MAYSKVNYEQVEPVSDGLHFLREPLETSELGLSVLECDAGWTGMEHDHGDDDHEEVYLLVDGAATVSVEGEDVEMEPGDAVRVAPDASRQITTDEDSTLVLAGAP